MAETIRSINCTSCGAGLSVLGGGRVAAQACEYCGALLDAQDNFKVLETYQNQPRPDTPLSLGMTAEIDGVDWTVIGTLAQRERYEGQEWNWVEHQLFSPTHGYCWVAIEGGHFSFTRKVRGLGQSGWWTEARVNVAENRPVTYWDGMRFQYYECGVIETAYAEGSFNFAPRRGDRTPYVTFMGDTYQLTQALNGPEREVELTRYMAPEDVRAGFGLETLPPTEGVHPLQPFTPWKYGAFTRNAGFAAAAIGFVLWLMMVGTPVTILDERDLATTRLASLATRPVSVSFELTNPNDLTRLSFESNANNAWTWYDIEIENPSGETVAAFGRQTEFYTGVEDGERWSEGSRRSSATLRLTEPGTYTVHIEQSEAGTWSGGRTPNRMRITVEEGVKAPGWLLLATLLSAMAGLVVLGRRLFHKSRRWSGSDWTEEDD